MILKSDLKYFNFLNFWWNRHQIIFPLEASCKNTTNAEFPSKISNIVTSFIILSIGVSYLGVVQDVRSQGKRGFSSADIFRTRESSDADVRTFWCKKLWIFQNLWCVRTRIGSIIITLFRVIVIEDF